MNNEEKKFKETLHGKLTMDEELKEMRNISIESILVSIPKDKQADTAALLIAMTDAIYTSGVRNGVEVIGMLASHKVLQKEAVNGRRS